VEPNLSQRPVALVTGASQGIGRALCQKLNTNYYIIAICQKWHAGNKTLPQHTTYIDADLADPKSRCRLISQIKDLTKRLDLLIHCAGSQQEVPFHEDGWDLISKELELNLMAPMQLTLGLSSLLSATDSSTVINIGSVLAFQHRKQSPTYSVSKSGLHRFSEILNTDEYNFRAIEFIPPMVATQMTKDRNNGSMMSPQVAADFMLNNLHRTGVIAFGKAKAGVLLNKISPSLLSRIVNP